MPFCVYKYSMKFREENIMACVVVPMVEAVITTITTKAVESREISADNHSEGESTGFSRKMKWLNNMLWGGSALLMFEHVWHGEIAPFFPFLTAASDPASLSEMLQEMSTAGVGMSLLVTAAWLGMVAVTSAIEKKAQKAQPSEE